MQAGKLLGAKLLTLAWVVLVLVLPLAALVEQAWPLELLAGERAALLRTLVRSSGLAFVGATASVGVGLVLALGVGPLPLLVLLLIGRAIASHGVLALGLAPGPAAALLTLIIDVAPFAALILWLRLRTRPLALIEAAADLGANAWVRVRELEWPHLRSALALAWLWAALQVLGDVIAFEHAGGGHSYTLGLWIRDALIHEQAPDRGLIGVLILLIPALPCAWAITRELRAATAGDVRRASASPGLGLRVIGWLTMAALLLGPLWLLLGEHPQGFAAADRAMARLAGRSVQLAGVVAVLACVLGFALALLSPRGRAPGSGRGADEPGWLGAVVLAPLAIPASVQGLLMLTAGSRVGIGPGPALTMLALLGPALALAFVAARLWLSQVPTVLIECAADLGATPRQRLRWVWLPLSRTAMLVALVLVFAWVIGQAAIPAFTSGPGGDTLAVGLTIHARAGAMPLVRRWSLVLVLTAAVASLLVYASTRRRSP